MSLPLLKTLPYVLIATVMIRSRFKSFSLGKQLGFLFSLLLVLFTQPASGLQFLGFNNGPFYSLVGSTGAFTVPTPLYVVFDGPVPTDTFVPISSSDPSRVTITGGAVIVPAGQTTAVVLMDSYDLGSVTLTGYFGPTVATTTVSVVSEVPVIPELKVTPLPGAVRLTWPTNATGFLLETNNSLSNPATWGVLTTNYSTFNTDYAVTNAISSTTMFYRLRQP